MKEVKLSFDDSIIALAGDGYGRKVCREQIIGNVDLDKPFTIIFPERIAILSTHFVSGMIDEMLNYSFVGIDTIRKNINIKGNERFVKRFYWTIDKDKRNASLANYELV